ncbi:hypothetical protein MUK42_19902 [Musa troglodytarum]|uniref:Uncharacterized protein n=1 Tax=Musa troglodytarum TaxID=320322 RepID=A0A9E7FUA3_9LILI|nr:hypothetical protein MUK42_19902 [Musa troglodytarum]
MQEKKKKKKKKKKNKTTTVVRPFSPTTREFCDILSTLWHTQISVQLPVDPHPSTIKENKAALPTLKLSHSS